MSIERSHFDRESSAYPETVGEARAQSLKWQLILERAAPGLVAADIGAASGRHAIPLARLGATVVAVDISTEMLARLKKRSLEAGANVHAVASELPGLALHPERFDLAYCYSTLLLLPHDQQIAAIQTLAGLLRPGGTLILDIAGACSLSLLYWRRYYRKLGFPGIFGWRLSQVKDLVAENNLIVTGIYPQGALSQFLLLPGATRFPQLERLIRGDRNRHGFDEVVSKWLPALAERWYVMAQRPSRGS